MVFILVWNASVWGVFLSKIINTNPIVALSYLPHRLLEMSGFVLAGIAGALLYHISLSILRKDTTIKEFLGES